MTTNSRSPAMLRHSKCMVKRQRLQALVGKSHNAHQRTLRIAYVAYVYAIFDYGATMYFAHASPVVRAVRLEAE